jgi:hypothetical protein
MCPFCGCPAWSRHGGACPRNPWLVLSRVLRNPDVLNSVFLSTALGVVCFTVGLVWLR